MRQSPFVSRKAWSEHDKQHRCISNFYCDLCKYHSGTSNDFDEHISQKHAKLNRYQRDAFFSAATRTSDAKFTELTCPLCEKQDFSSLPKFSSHVCSHMEDIALSILPQELYGDEDEDEDEDGELEEIWKAQTVYDPSVTSTVKHLMTDLATYSQKVRLRFRKGDGSISEQILAVVHDTDNPHSVISSRVLNESGIEYSNRHTIIILSSVRCYATGPLELVVSYVNAPEQEQNVRFYVVDDVKSIGMPAFDALLGSDCIESLGIPLEVDTCAPAEKSPFFAPTHAVSDKLEDETLSQSQLWHTSQAKGHTYVAPETGGNARVREGDFYAFDNEGQANVGLHRGNFYGNLLVENNARLHQDDYDFSDPQSTIYGHQFHNITAQGNSDLMLGDVYSGIASNASVAKDDQAQPAVKSQPNINRGRRALAKCMTCRMDKRFCHFSDGPWNEEERGPACDRCKMKGIQCDGPVVISRRRRAKSNQGPSLDYFPMDQTHESEL